MSRLGLENKTITFGFLVEAGWNLYQGELILRMKMKLNLLQL